MSNQKVNDITSIILLNYNDYWNTIKLANQVSKYSTIDFVIIVDNCSTDKSITFIKKIITNKVILVENTQNNGYSAGNNIGIRYAIETLQSSTIIIANPDIYIENQTIKNLKDKLNGDDSIAIISALMENDKGKVFKNFAIKTPSFLTLLIDSNMIFSKISETIFHRSRYYTIDNTQSEMDVDAIQGSFFLIKADCIKSIGYFDENVFLYCEEILLAHKIQSIRKRTVILTTERFVHFHSLSIGKNISSYIAREKIKEKSYEYYLLEYLKCSRLQLIVFRLFFNFGIYINSISRKILRII